MSQTNTSLVTVVKNMSGASRFFGFLPPHGKRLAANASASVTGDLLTQINARQQTALYNSLIAGDIEIVKTPAPHLYDATRSEIRVLKLNNNTLGHQDPSWVPAASSGAGTN